MTQQGETPDQDVMTTAKLVGEVVHAFTEHGLAVERDLAQAQQGARNLGLQLRMAHRAMDEGERQIGEYVERVARLEVLVEEAFALVGKAFCSNGPVTSLWQEAAMGWSDRVNAARPDTSRLNLTDTFEMPAGRDPEDLDASA